MAIHSCRDSERNRIKNLSYNSTTYKKIEAFQIFVAIFILALASPLTFASDPSPLQDFCVAINDPKGSVFVNGKFCKDAKLAKADDFYFSGLHICKNTSNTFRSTVTPLNVAHMAGLHTLGIYMVRIDDAPNSGLNPPHTHPCASEILFVLEGTLHVGFVTSNPDNGLISKVLYPGDVFVFPVGLIHFQYNIGNTYAVTFAGLSSENPGVITIANAVFGSNPSINADILAKLELLAGSGFLASGHDRRGVQVGPATNQCIDREGRLETYTFHLICRECTITLEDVQLQLGLPVDGYAATGFAQSTNWRAVYYKLLGVIPDNINGGRIEVGWL
ncbi:germin-like protein subfamily 1 member 11 [Gossypium arboreum]|uniref:germin-like protein subfamily 1 member 11 n=1 Tax=Gossypium arboreum TaxID=29729 RepID=UPI0022F17C8E|nr:germin-like protein subfamily 1 member 11 [Gossypium arboreum]